MRDLMPDVEVVRALITHAQSKSLEPSGLVFFLSKGVLLWIRQ